MARWIESYACEFCWIGFFFRPIVTGLGCTEATMMIQRYHRWIVRRWVVLGMLALGTGFGGCASLEDYHYYKVNRIRAAAAWSNAKSCLPASAINHDFACGFKEGYYSVATGGSHCPPVAPPPCYWAAKYQSTQGQAAVNQWFQGFQSGVIAADRDGRSIWTTVPTQDGPGISGCISNVPEMTYSTDTISE